MARSSRHPNPLAGFSWVKPIGRFQIADQDTEREQYGRLTWKGRHDPRMYYPLREHDGLFMTLAYLSDDDQSIVEFASQYGPLSLSEDVDGLAEFRSDYSGPWYNALYGTSGDTRLVVQFHTNQRQIDGGLIPHWRTVIGELKWWVAAWELVKDRDYAGLSERFKGWTGGFEYLDESREHWMDGPRLREYREMFPDVPDISPSARDEDVFVYLVRITIQKEINRRLHGHCNFVVGFADKAHSKEETLIIPDSLETAIWCQFAEAVQRRKDYRSCIQCDRWFHIRSNRKQIYCSDSCRTRAFRDGKTS